MVKLSEFFVKASNHMQASLLYISSCIWSAQHPMAGQKKLKMKISTSIWCVQHPNAGQNIQHSLAMGPNYPHFCVYIHKLLGACAQPTQPIHVHTSICVAVYIVKTLDRVNSSNFVK